MFGFGKSDSKPKKREWYDTIRDKYGMDYGVDVDAKNKLYASLGTSNLDYLLERFAPNFISNVADVKQAQDEASCWKGRYYELLDEHRALYKRFDKLLKNFNQPIRPIDEIMDELEEKIEKNHPVR